MKQEVSHEIKDHDLRNGLQPDSVLGAVVPPMSLWKSISASAASSFSHPAERSIQYRI
jgi:hypothetical protein